MKTKPAILCAALLTLILSAAMVLAQTDPRNNRYAIVISLDGKCYYSTPGIPKAELSAGLSLPQGAKVWTEKGGTAELYFRQIASIFKMMPNTEVVLEKLDKRMKDGYLVKETVIALNKGRILTRARVLLPESRFEVRTPFSTISVPDVGYARYDIRADGTMVVGKKSKLPARVVTGSSTNQVMPATIIGKNGKTNRVDQKVLEEITPQLDQLEALADVLTPPPGPQEVRPGQAPK